MCEIENELIRKYSNINSYYSFKTKVYLNKSMDILAGEPQTDVPVGNNTQTESTTGASSSGWQGMTIKDILDKVDLFNFTMLSDEDEEKLKAAKAELEAPEPVVRKSLRVISDNSKQYFAWTTKLQLQIVYFRKRSPRSSSQSQHQHS